MVKATRLLSRLIVPWAKIFTAAFGVFGVLRLLVTERRRRKQLPYRLIEPIGEGGMGDVWRAADLAGGELRALKLLKPHGTGRAALELDNEYRVLRRLSSPHLVSVHDRGVCPDGRDWFAMDLLDGDDLRELVEERGPQSVAVVVDVLRQVSALLDTVHAAGLVHRDIKPANIVRCHDGTVKVVDFGLAEPPISGEHSSEFVNGSPAFMPPEVVAGRGVDGRADVYALGCVGWYLLTGELVFEGESRLEVMRHHLRTEPMPPSECGADVPAWLEEVILRCLRKDPAQRPASGAELVSLLDGASRQHRRAA